MILYEKLLFVVFDSLFHFSLNLRDNGEHGLNLLILELAVLIVLGDLDNKTGASEYTDKVGDHHETVEGIGDIPCKGRSKERTEKDHYKVDNSVSLNGLNTEEIFPSLGAVVVPTESGGECEEKDSDRYKALTDSTEMSTECGSNESCVVDTCDTTLNSEFVEVKMGKYNKCGHGADYHGISEYLEDTPETLTNGLLNVGVAVNHNGRTETCLVGEHAALTTGGNYLADKITCAAADSCGNVECILEDCNKCIVKLCVVEAKDRNGADYEENDHERNDLFSNVCDSLKTAEKDKSCDHGKDDTENEVVKGNALIKSYAGKCLDLECGNHVNNDLVDLAHCTDTEGSENCEDAEEDCKRLTEELTELHLAHALFEVVHRTAGPFAFSVLAAEVDTENVFGVVGHHSEECGNPHPENRTGTAGNDSCSNTGDVTYTDSSRKSGTERLELGNGLTLNVTGYVLLKDLTEGLTEPVTDMSHLKYACDNGSEHTYEKKQPYAVIPDKAVNSVIDFCNQFHNEKPSSL